MLRVLTLSTLFPNEAQPGLGVNVLRQTSRLADAPGVEVEVIAPIPRFPLPLPHLPYSETRAVLTGGRQGEVRVHHPRYATVPKLGWRISPRAVAKVAVEVGQALHRARPFDLIACEYFFPDAPAASALSRALGLPFTVKARGSDIQLWGQRPRARRQMLEAGRDAEGLLAVSEALKEQMVRLGLPRELIEVHYTGVDLSRFSPEAGERPQQPTLLAVGNLVPLKRVGLLIDMMVQLPGCRLDIVGDGPERAALEQRAEALGLSRQVRFAGRLPHHELPRRLASAHLLVHASEAEGLANVWVEALASGTPVVTTDVGGAAEAVPSEAGRLVPANAAPEDFAAAVRELLAHPPQAQHVRSAAQRFSWQRNIDALLAHYQRVAGH